MWREVMQCNVRYYLIALCCLCDVCLHVYMCGHVYLRVCMQAMHAGMHVCMYCRCVRMHACLYVLYAMYVICVMHVFTYCM